MGYIPLWGCIIIVIGLNLDIIRRVRESLLHRSSVLTQDNASASNHTQTMIPKKTKEEFIRLILICILYAVVHVPASYVRVMGAMNKVVEPKLNTVMVLAFSVCLPLPGILNLFVWVASDKQVMNDWIELLHLPKISYFNTSSTQYLQHQNKDIKHTTNKIQIQPHPNIISNNDNNNNESNNQLSIIQQQYQQ